MIRSISHNREDETLEGKARWFQSLSLKERAEMLCQYTDMILSVNPAIGELRRFYTASRVRPLTPKEDLITSKRAAGGAVDLEDLRLLELDSE